MRKWLKREPLPAAADDAPAAGFLYCQHAGDVRLPAVDNADIPKRQIQPLQITKGRLKTRNTVSDGLSVSFNCGLPNIRFDFPLQARMFGQLEFRVFAHSEFGRIIFQQQEHQRRQQQDGN